MVRENFDDREYMLTQRVKPIVDLDVVVIIVVMMFLHMITNCDYCRYTSAYAHKSMYAVHTRSTNLISDLR